MKLFKTILCCVLLVLMLAGCGETAASRESVEELALVVTEADIAQLDNYPNLKRVDLSGSTCYDAIEAYIAAHPGVAVTYTVAIGSETFSPDATTLTITELNLEQLLANLKYLPKVTAIDLGNAALAPADLAAITAACPGVSVSCALELLGQSYAMDTTELDLSGITSADVDAVAAALPGFTAVTYVELMDDSGKSSLSLTDVKALQDALPGALFHYSFDLFGKTVSTTDETIEYFDVQIGNEGEEEIRQALDVLTACTYFKLDNCGIDSAVMAGIRDDYPEVKVVWRIWADYFTMCTDETMIRMTFDLQDEDIAELKYCTDVTYIDIGHNEELTDISFVEYMPNLECVIVSGSPLTDISYFADHDKLTWLELCFCGNVQDLSVLATCDNLTYLNVSYSKVSDLSALKDLPLERFNCMNTNVSAATQNEFKQWHPDCISIFSGRQPYGYGWRYNDYGYTYFDYYANMRIVFRYDDKSYHGNIMER